MKINLNKNQIITIIGALQMAKNLDFGTSDPINMRYTRIEKKLEKELDKERLKTITTKK